MTHLVLERCRTYVCMLWSSKCLCDVSSLNYQPTVYNSLLRTQNCTDMTRNTRLFLIAQEAGIHSKMLRNNMQFILNSVVCHAILQQNFEYTNNRKRNCNKYLESKHTMSMYEIIPWSKSRFRHPSKSCKVICYVQYEPTKWSHCLDSCIHDHLMEFVCIATMQKHDI
jgi:hypothetical protein